MRRTATTKGMTALVLAVVLVLAPACIARADFTVQLEANPENGGTVTGGGTFSDGSSVDILATPADGYTFVGWYKEGETEPFTTNPGYTYQLGADRVYIARFERALTVGVTADPAEGGIVSQSGDGNYVPGDSVTVTATPNPNYAFVGWFISSSTADPVSVDASYTFDVENSTQLIAKFSAQHMLHVNISPEGTGTVAGNGSFAGGSIVTLEAIPNDDYRFVSWVSPADPDTVISKDNPYSFNLDSDLTLTATFARSYGYIWLRIGIVAGCIAVAAFVVWFILRRRAGRLAPAAASSGRPGGSRDTAKRWHWKWGDAIRDFFGRLTGPKKGGKRK